MNIQSTSLVLAVLACASLTACHHEIARPSQLQDRGYSAGGCAKTRYNGAVSPYGSFIGPSVTGVKGAGTFLPAGTKVTLDKIEWSYDFENGNRVRVYIHADVRGKSRPYYLEKGQHERATQAHANAFLESQLVPCRE